MTRRTPTWRHLLPGLIGIGVLSIAAGLVLVFARVGALHGSTFRLYVKSNDAIGVMKGSEVWLSGQTVGEVVGIHFLPPSNDSLSRIALSLDILDPYHPLIRRDSRVTLESGKGPFGATVVKVEPGRSESNQLGDGDTLTRSLSYVADTFHVAIARVERALPALTRNLDEITDALRSTHQRMVGIMTRPNASLEQVDRTLGDLLDRMADSGTIARSQRGHVLEAEVERMRVSLDSLQAVSNAGGSLGKLRRDSVLAAGTARLQARLTTLQAQLTTEQGTLGRLQYDSALTWQMQAMRKEIAELVADLKANPSRYLQ